MDEFKKYIESVGGVPVASKRLGVSPELLYAINRQSRAISKRLAEKIESDSNGVFRKERLLWGDEAAA